MNEIQNLLIQFLFALLGSCGFALLVHVPAKRLLPGCLIGGIAWLFYYYIGISENGSKVLACFLAACAVGFLADICSRLLHDAATIFTIPGIIPLVPGAGMYYAMMAAVSGDLNTAGAKGVEVLLLAGSIAAGLLVAGALISTVRNIGKHIFERDKDFL